MYRSQLDLIREVENLENVVFVCFGRPKGDELPQVATEKDIVVDLLHSMAGGNASHEFYDRTDA